MKKSINSLLLKRNSGMEPVYRHYWFTKFQALYLKKPYTNVYSYYIHNNNDSTTLMGIKTTNTISREVSAALSRPLVHGNLRQEHNIIGTNLSSITICF